ncbi:non-ribosomal peptide synthetase [Gordonia iterans]|uniref:non-ribosomal peptide synthetase n=1 Tax=Gordonia iterans TaxID=1004901 RepID=UPI00131D4A1F|nr:non-ribosomal peptide synthase/polyketide synthase [Gordonia iterans]
MPEVSERGSHEAAAALVFGNRRVSRAEFNARVATLARKLIAAGVGPEVAVAVAMPRSVELLVSLHAIEAAGGQFVPLDIDAPEGRTEYMVTTAGADLVLIRAGDLPASVRGLGERVRLLSVDCASEVDLAACPLDDDERLTPLLPENAAYTLFTSGSTGRPKGVTVAHRAIVNRLAWMRDWSSLGSEDIFLQKTPITFDVSVPELFLPMTIGATLVIAEPGRHGDPQYLFDLIKREQITVVHFVPSMAAAFLDILGDRIRQLTSVRMIFASGEALPPAVAQRLLDVFPHAELHNLYGPTEAAVEVIGQQVRRGDETVPIGSPVPGTTSYVLDDRLQLVPTGVPGELYLGGVQVARGYAAAPALTAERFVADPFGQPGERLYRTGDLVRWNKRGEIDYLGRTDFQVKLRGQRIELGEIEAAIADVPGVVHAAATVLEAPGGGEFLVGYAAPSSVDLEQVKGGVETALPEYMRPSVWVLLDDVTLNTAGKLDRKALPAPDFDVAETQYVAPETDAERIVAEVFADVLGVERVSVTGSFFDAGGNSLSAMRLVARAGESLGVEFSVRDLFDAPTVRELVAAVADRAPALPPVTAAMPRPEMIPLSFAQQRMWFINRLDPSAPTYNIPSAFRLRGAVDLDALRQAVSDVVARHEVLRTVFPDREGVPYQLVVEAGEADTRLDWRVVETTEEVLAELRRGFDVTIELPVRVRLVAESADSLVLALVVHHIAFDGQSFGPMVGDLLTAYAARSVGAVPEFVPLPVQYSDYSVWQHDVLGSPEDPASVMGRQLAYWTDVLAGVPEVIELPTDRPRPAVFSSAGDQVKFAIPAKLGVEIDRFAAESGASRFMVLHAVFASLLARMSGASDIVLGTPIDGRGPRGLDALVGMFVNTLVLRTQIDPAESFEALMARTRAADLDALAHAEVPFESIVDAVDPVRSEAFSPLVQVILSVDPLAQASDESVPVGEVTVEPFDGADTPAQMDLNLTIAGADDGASDWTGLLTFATSIFDHSTIEKLGERFVRLLEGVLSSPTAPVGDLTLVDDVESATVRAESVGPVEPILDETIADAVATQVAARPDALALVAGEREFSYGEFGARIGELARTLIVAGVGPETAVGVVMDRSAELVTSVHAVMAAGGQYVPIATDSPAERAEYVASTAGVQLVLVANGAEVPEFVAGLNVPVIEVDCSSELAADAKPLDSSERLVPLRASDAAYTLFTSGSTGLPKGVTIPHGAVRNFVAWFDQTVPAGDQRLLFKTPHTFDASVLELFWPLVAGQTMVIADAGGERDPQYLADVMNAADVSVVQFVPSLLAAFLDIVGDEPLLPNLQVLFSGGEALPPAVAKDFRRRVPQAKVVNLFGPTEAAVYTMSAVLDEVDQVVPIGAPMANTTAFILDSRLHPVPDGVAGELYLGGVQSARGYASRPDLTAERFIADPFGEAGSRLYRTGDLVKRSSDSGELEYLGRTDFQVKLRGQRLELGEVEAAIAGVDGVVHAAARVVEGPAGDQLVGYVAPASVDTNAIAVELAKQLPEYMVPTAWVTLAEMPLNTAGKVDRRSLPEPEFAAVEYVAPETPEEETVAVVYADLLGVDRVSVTESFFDAGGNSLAAMRLVARVSDALGVQVSVRDVFDAPSVRELVAEVAGRAPALPPVTKADPRPAQIPLSFAQQRMWFINRFDPSLPTYNIPAVMRITGALDVAALQAAFADVVARHEVLRTTFPDADGAPVQVIAPESAVAAQLPWIEVESEAELVAEVSAGFDVTEQWPIRAVICPVGADGFVFAVVAHHIATDGESMGPLVADVLTAYAARAAGQEPPFAPLPVQFADFAIWQRDVLGAPDEADSVLGRQLSYWRDALADLPDVLELPTDRPRPAVASYVGAEVRFEIPARVSERVAAVAGAHDVTPFMVVHGALAVLLARLSATQDIAVATPVAGRGQAELDALVGMFVNTLVLRTQVDSGVSFTDVLARVRQGDLDAFAHQEVPFEAVVDAIDPVRSEAFSPLAQVMLSFDPGASMRGIEADVQGLRVAGVPDPFVPAQVDLTFRVLPDGDGTWSGAVVYATDLFDESTARSLADRFVAFLDELTSDPGSAVGDVALLDQSARDEVLAVSSGPAVQAPALPIADAVAAQVAATPDAAALVFEGREVSYAEFGARVATLARELIAAGVGPDVAVGVCIDRSVELLVAIHAITAAGGQYVPVDIAAPVERARVMLDTAGAQVVLVAAGTAPEPVAGLESRVIEVDGAAEVDLSVAAVTDAERLAPLHGDSALYTLFTSGSTGTPKGVTVSHEAVLNRLVWMRDDYGLAADARFLQKTPYTFDVSVWELFLPLLIGAPLVIARPDGHRDPQYLASVIAEEQVSVVHFVPSMLSVFLDVVGDGVAALTSLTEVFTSGEALAPAIAQELLTVLPSTELHNLYGPTEAAVDVTAVQVLPGDELVTIGRAVANTTALVLDDRLQPVPDGVPGELYLGGVQIARGYAAAPALTAERFVADPFGEPGSRLYRTGDLVKRQAGGDLEYLGRTDFQVKLRGQRIELGEIEAVIAGAPGVVHAAATVAQASTGGEFLVGYVSPASVDLDSVKEHVAAALPEYMQPSVWNLIDDVVLNSAGKLDRKALPAPDFSAAQSEYAAPVGSVEEQLAAIVGGLLGIDRVSVTESFFALGGDSIMSIRLASAARAAGWELSPREIFESRTVRKMAALVTNSDRGVQVLDELPGGGVGESVIRPITSWMLEHSSQPSDFADFAQSMVLVAPAGMTPEALADILAAIVAAHPMLSARLEIVDEAWTLTAGTEFDAAESVLSVQSTNDSGTEEFGADVLRAYTEAVSGMDPAAGRLLRACLVTTGDDRARIVLAIHHLGVDAVSWPILIEDLITAWAQHQEGKPISLRAEGTSQRAWAGAVAGLREEFEEQSGYWLERLPELPTGLGSRFDASRDRDKTSVALVHNVEGEVADEVLTRLPEAFGGTVDDVLLGTFARAVRGWQRSRGIDAAATVSVLAEGHGRDEHLLDRGDEPRRADLSRTVGWFTTLAPLKLDPAADVVHAIKAAKEERLGTPDGGAGFGVLRYRENGERAIGDLGSRPLPSILFNYLGATGAAGVGVETPFATAGDVPPLPGSVRGEMTMSAALIIDAMSVASEDGRRLQVRFRFPEAMLQAEDVQRLADQWSAELSAAVEAGRNQIGLSPSDVPGSGITQEELDLIALDLPGAQVWPLTPLQAGLFFQAGMVRDDELDVYHVQARVQFGDVDTDRLQAAMGILLQHHEVLRSGFRQIEAGAVAVVPDDVAVPLREADLGDLDDEAAEVRLAEIADTERAQRFDLSSPPLMRAILVRHPNGADLIVTSHHILFDGWSGPLVLTDLLAAYATGAPYTPTHEHSFADHARAVARTDTAAGIAAWQENLADVDGPTRIAPAGTTAIDQAPREVGFALADDTSAKVLRLARECGATLSTVLQAAWAVLLSRLTGNRVVTFGETVSGRPADLDGVDTMVGLFINTLPVVVDIDPSVTFREMLAALQRDKVRVLDHHHIGLPDLARIAPQALEFDTLFIHESYPIDTESISEAGSDGLELRGISMRDATHYPVSFITEEHGGRVSGHLKYLPDVFGEEQVKVLADAIAEILRAGAAVPDELVADLPLLTVAGAEAEVGREWGRSVGLPAVVSVADAVAGQVARTPEATALVFGGREVSYGEFGARVNVFARELIAAGVGPEVSVAVAVPRSVEMMVAIHAVVAAGGQYVPIDLGTPVDRAEYMLTTSGAKLLVVSDRSLVGDALAAAEAAGVPVCGVDASAPVDADSAAAAPVTDGDRLSPLRADSAVYTLFTSGSTGMPKGVTLTHEAVLNRFWWGLDELPIDASDVVVQKTPYTFDCSVPELFAPLMVGASLVVLKQGGHLEPVYVAEEIARTQATMVHFVPSMLSVFLDVVPESLLQRLDSVRIVSTTGEALPPAVAAPARGVWPEALFYNLYGPTEAAIEITYQRIGQVSAEDPTVPIGVPVWNSSAVVLDGRLHRVPAGVPGELYLGGVQLARGYAARPDLTAERFVADPHGAPGARLYRTGDLVRRLGDGSLEYLGRTDFQIKLRGQRIELGEIEAVLAAAPGVVHTAVTVAVSPDGGEHLVGYVCAGPGEILDLDAVKVSTSAALPGYMVPTVWMVVDDIALNTAGKIDRKSLPAPEFGGLEAEYVAPEGEAEEALARVFVDVLGVERVSATESFFDAGGNSLSAMRLVARAGEALGVEFTVRDLFEAPTVRELAAASVGKAVALPPVTAVVPRPEQVPLSFAQHRMWLLNQANPDSSAYNIPMGLRVTGPLDLDALHTAMVDVVVRHEVLRTTFPSVDGNPRQKIARESSVAARLDWDVVDSADEIQEALTSGFNLTRQTPIRIRVLAVGPDEHIVVVVVHHIAFDGESMAPFVTDLLTAYLAEADDRDPEFTELPYGFADYALWQHEVLGTPEDPDSVVGGQLGYWKTQLAGLPELVELPLDRPRPPVASQRGDLVPFVIPEAVATGIRALADQSGATPFMVVHAALAALLARMTGQRDIAIGTPIAGRGQAGLEHLVGMFVNTLVLRTGVPRGITFDELLAEAKRADLDAYVNADVPFETVVEELGIVQSSAFSPFTQVWLTFNQTDVPELAGETLAGAEFGGLTVEPVAAPETPAKIDLLVTVADTDGDWSGSLLYATDLFDRRSMDMVAAYLVASLEQVVADPSLPVASITLPENVAESSAASTAAPSVSDVPEVRKARTIPTDGAIVSGGAGVDPVLLSEIFAQAVDKWGPRQAVVDPDGSYLTYADLDARSNRLARWLINQGVGSEQLVALAIERSSQLLVAIWAVAKTGAGYVPIDPTYPADRVASMIEDSGASVGLAIAASGHLPAGGFAWYRLDDDGLAAEIDELDSKAVTDVDRLRPVRIDNTAYVIFTSGSTGRPKGVSVTHAGLANFADEEVRRSEADERSRVLGFASPSFDASVLEYLLAARSGGVLVYRPTEAVGGQVLQDFMMRHAVTHTFLTPSVLATMDPATLPALRVVYAGGEAVPQALKDQWAMFPRIQNLYGPTETTIGVAISEPMQVGAPVYLGGPLAGVGFLVLDDELQPVPVGVPGELYVCGDQLARGYLGVPALTASRFVANPYGIPGDRMYRTGDVVRWRNDDGGHRVIEYTGRSDDQIKLRGLRIELGEIETVLAGHPDVVTAVVVGVGGSVATALAGYVAVRSGAQAEPAQLRSFLAERLPSHMVPASINVLDTMPLTPVGKLDKNALPEPVVEATEYIAPEGAEEVAIAEVFAEILGMDQISVTESFFDLGGNSLSAMRVVGRVGEILDVEVSIADVFAAPTVRELASALADRGSALPPVTAVVPRPDRVPLSFAQQRMWFINRLEPDAPTYNIPVVLRLSGDVNVEALRASVADVVRRHEVLRTTFPDVEGVPVQVIAPESSVDADLVWIETDSVEAFGSAVSAGFDVTMQWPIRVVICREGGDYLFAVVAHHIAADGESMLPLVTDVLTAYAARAAGEVPVFAPLPVQFADFALWQHEVLGAPEVADSVLGRQLVFWREALAGLPDVLDLPMDRPRPAIASHVGGQVSFVIPAEIGDRIAGLTAGSGLTPFMVVHAGLSVLLARLSATGDVAVATPIAGRGSESLDALVGMFVNTLVLRARVDSSMSFAELLDQVRVSDLDAFAHAEVPFESVVEALDPVRSEAFSPLAQVMLSFDPAASVGQAEMEIAGISAQALAAPVVPAQVDLTFNVSSAAAGRDWAGSILYATDLFDEATVQSFADRLVVLLDGVTADPAAPVGDVVLLNSGERERLPGPPAPVVPEGAERTLVELFAGSVERFGSSPAVSALGVTVSYAELDSRSDAVAAGLVAAGVRAGDLVGLATARSVDLPVAILGVLKAGGAYLPLDVTNPVERLSYIVGDAGVSVVLTDASTQGHELWSAVGAGVAVLDVDRVIVENAGASFTSVSVPSSSRAYVIYTSGSTGLPKGVEVTHADVAALMAACAQDFDFRPDDVWTMFHSYAFDFSVWELWGPLLSGARVVIVDRDLARDLDAFVQLLADEQVTFLNLTPSAFYQVIDARRRNPSAESALRYIVFGGEELAFDQVRRWFDENPDDRARLVNMYGITETTVHVSFREIDRGDVRSADPSFIGRPLSTLAIHILDDRLRPVPQGVPGEMYVAGAQLAQGYLARPDLTGTRFVANPFASDGSRLYRTGDRARRVGDDIEYLGRADGQAQLRGFRIEYGEVEAALLAADGVTGAAATVIVDSQRGDALIGYVVADAGVELDVQAIREQAGKHVPRYMIPDLVMVVDQLPLTANGKLDRKALPAPDFGRVLEEYVAPEGAAEEALAAVFADVLGLDQVSVTASFFDAGGNSLSAMRVVARAGDALGVELSIRDLFDAPTVRELAAASVGKAPALPPVTAVVPRPERIPLSFAQQRMWFINQFEPGTATYNIPIAIRIAGDLDVGAMRAAASDVVRRHEVLRTVFPAVEGEPTQRILSADEAIADLDLSVVGSQEELFAAAAAGFDVTRRPPLRIRLWEETPGEWLLLAVLHHIVSDGESGMPLITDMVTAYVARAKGEDPAFTPLPVQFADVAIWQHAVLGDPTNQRSIAGKQLAHWENALAGIPDVLELPADHPRPPVASYAGAGFDFELSAEVGARVEQVARVRGASVFMVVHAALATLLARLSASDDVTIATPIAGRGQAELDGLIGMFVNTLVLRSQVDIGDSFLGVLDATRDVDLEAFAHADVPFESVVDRLNPVRSQAFSPLAQVMLSVNHQRPPKQVVELDGLTVAPLEVPITTAQMDLSFTVQARAGDPWTVSIVYATDLFAEPTIAKLAERFSAVLDALTQSPNKPVALAPLLDSSERLEIAGWTTGSSPTGDADTLTGLIE